MTEPSFAARYGPRALVTGGALGIGRSFARRLAARGVDLLLVDKQAEPLADTAKALVETHGVEVDLLVADLGEAGSLDEVCRFGEAFDLGLLVNNAGFGHVGHFLEIPLEEHLGVIDLNVRAPLVLSHRLLPRLVERGRGGVIFVASNTALTGTPGISNYAATKAFDWSLGEGLFGEFEPQGIDVLSLMPGLTVTDSIRRGGMPEDLVRKIGMDPDDVAEEALRALGRKPSVVAGWRNKLTGYLSQRLMPRAAVLRSIKKRALRED